MNNYLIASAYPGFEPILPWSLRSDIELIGKPIVPLWPNVVM